LLLGQPPLLGLELERGLPLLTPLLPPGLALLAPLLLLHGRQLLGLLQELTLLGLHLLLLLPQGFLLFLCTCHVVCRVVQVSIQVAHEVVCACAYFAQPLLFVELGPFLLAPPEAVFVTPALLGPP